MTLSSYLIPDKIAILGGNVLTVEGKKIIAWPCRRQGKSAGRGQSAKWPDLAPRGLPLPKARPVKSVTRNLIHLIIFLGNFTTKLITFSGPNNNTSIIVKNGCAIFFNTSIFIVPSDSVYSFTIINSSCIIGEFEHATIPSSKTCGKVFKIIYKADSIDFFSGFSDCETLNLATIIAIFIIGIISLTFVVVVFSVKKIRMKILPFSKKKRRDWVIND